jgi:hypothetical protein
MASPALRSVRRLRFPTCAWRRHDLEIEAAVGVHAIHLGFRLGARLRDHRRIQGLHDFAIRGRQRSRLRATQMRDLVFELGNAGLRGLQVGHRIGQALGTALGGLFGLCRLLGRKEPGDYLLKVALARAPSEARFQAPQCGCICGARIAPNSEMKSMQVGGGLLRHHGLHHGAEVSARGSLFFFRGVTMVQAPQRSARRRRCPNCRRSGYPSFYRYL